MDELLSSLDWHAEKAALAVREQGAPSNRSIRWPEFKLVNQDTIDDLILEAHFVAPVWSDYVLVAERPTIWELASHAANYGLDWRVFVADDSLIAVTERSADVLMTISPVAVGETIQYQLSLHAFVLSESMFAFGALFHSFAHSYGLLQFPDSDLIDRYQVSATGGRLAEYLRDTSRSRPVFVCRRQTMLSGRARRLQRSAKFLLPGFGTVVTNDALFREYRSVVGPTKFGIIAVAPDGTALSVEPERSMFLRLAQFLERCNLQTPLQPSCRSSATSLAEAAWLPSRTLSASIEDRKAGGVEFRAFWAKFLERISELEARRSEPDLKEPAEEIIDDVRVEEPEQKPLHLDRAGYPVEAADIARWTDLNLSNEIVLLPRARRALAKAGHPEPRRIAEALEALAGPKLRGYRGQGDTHNAFEDDLMRLRLRDGFSNAERLKGQTGEAYVVQHDGRRLLLQRHLCSNASGFNDPRMIRIYYVYDRASQKIVVGWLPTHLPTSQT